MLDRVRIRCRACGSAVPAAVLWAISESCPRCLQPLQVPVHQQIYRQVSGTAALRPPPARGAGSQEDPLGADHAGT